MEVTILESLFFKLCLPIYLYLCHLLAIDRLMEASPSFLEYLISIVYLRNEVTKLIKKMDEFVIRGIAIGNEEKL